MYPDGTQQIKENRIWQEQMRFSFYKRYNTSYSGNKIRLSKLIKGNKKGKEGLVSEDQNILTVDLVH